MGFISSEARGVFLQRLLSALDLALGKAGESSRIRVRFVPLLSANPNAYPPEVLPVISELKEHFAREAGPSFANPSDDLEDRYEHPLHSILARVLNEEDQSGEDDPIPFLFWASLSENQEDVLTSRGTYYYFYVSKTDFHQGGYFPRVQIEAPPNEICSTQFLKESALDQGVRENPDVLDKYFRYLDRTLKITYTLYQSALTLRSFSLYMLKDTLLSVGDDPGLVEDNLRLFPLVFFVHLPKTFGDEEKTEDLLQRTKSFLVSLSDELRFYLSTTTLSKEEAYERVLLPGELLDIVPEGLSSSALEAHIEISDGLDRYPNLFAKFESFAIPILIDRQSSETWATSSYLALESALERLSSFGGYNFTLRSERDPYAIGRSATLSLITISEEYNCSFSSKIAETQREFRERWSGTPSSRYETKGLFERLINSLRGLLYTASYGTDLHFRFLHAHVYNEDGSGFPIARFFSEVPLAYTPEVPWKPIGLGRMTSLESASPSYDGFFDEKYRPYEWGLLLDRESLGVSLLLVASHYFMSPLYAHYCLLPDNDRSLIETPGFRSTTVVRYVREKPRYPGFHFSLDVARSIFSQADGGVLGPSTKSLLDQYKRVYELLSPDDYIFPLVSMRTVYSTGEICEEVGDSIAIPTLHLFVFANEGAVKAAGKEIETLLLLTHQVLSRVGHLVEIEARLQKLPKSI